MPVDRLAPVRFLQTAYEPEDWVAVFLKSYTTGRVAQRVGSIARIADVRFQAWLRAENATGANVYISVNAVAPEQRSRRRGTIRTIRHVFVDADHDAPEVLRTIAARPLLGTANIVLRPLPAWVPAEKMIAGASFDAEGTPRLVLDADGLLATLAAAGRPALAAPTSPPPVLVIDDSLTTRMLEQSVLESAGYDVDLAASAQEALVKARTRRYGLFLLDVEMPGMDGFAFMETARSDAALRDVPTILMTSRDAREDRQRGQELGACAYVAKGEFDQRELLALIGKLLR